MIAKDSPYYTIDSLRFIDDCRLLGLAGDQYDGPVRVVLWDATVIGDTRTPRQLVFDLGPQWRIRRSFGSAIACDLESNYELPFRADPSTQLVGIEVRSNCVRKGRYLSRLLLIHSQVLSGYTSRIGTRPIVRWEEWLHFTKPIGIGGLDGNFHLLHSHLVCPSRISAKGYRTLVFNIPLKCRRQEGDCGAIGEYSDNEVSVGGGLWFADYLSTSNIIFRSCGLVSSTLLGTVFASSGLNVTTSSTLEA